MSDIRISHHPEADLVIFSVHSAFQVTEAIAVSEKFFSQHPVRDSVWDLREAIIEGFDVGETRTAYEAAVESDHHRDQPRSALVVANEADAAVARLYTVTTELSASIIQYRIFTQMGDAFDWLGKFPTSEPAVA